MERKAFYKIYAEAEEALANRRLLDMLALTEAILNDLEKDKNIDAIVNLRERYFSFLQTLHGIAREQRKVEANHFFCQAIELLQQARGKWNLEHTFGPEDAEARALPPSDDELLVLLKRLSQGDVGNDEFHQSLDQAFVILRKAPISAPILPTVTLALQHTDIFSRSTLVSALLLGLLDNFTLEKLHLLLSLTQPASFETTLPADLQARVAVALTIIYQRYQPFFDFYPDEYSQMHSFFASEGMRDQLSHLLHAFTAEALVDRVGKRVDDFMPIIREIFEKQQQRLGNNDDEPSEKKDGGIKDPFDFSSLNLNPAEGEKLMDKLASHARKIDEMRQADLDVNHPSFSHMKQFSFFNTPAHWFYPFSPDVPEIRSMQDPANTSSSRMMFRVLRSSHFCASDCYSYASMMVRLKKEKSNMTQFIDQQMDEMMSSIDEFMGPKDVQTLNPYTDYVQSLHRYFYQSKLRNLYFRPFELNDKVLLPLLPLFAGLFDREEIVKPTIATMQFLGAHEQVIILTDFAIEHFGADTDLLYTRGVAFMKMQQWKRALEVFQQVLLIADDAEAELCMARCFEALGRWDDALALLIKEEQRQTAANEAAAADIIEETGRCLIQLERWDDAVQRFFHLELLGRHLNVARRAIAWCSIHQGKYERAVNNYSQLIGRKKATWEDYLNQGHALWLAGKESEATAAYRTSQYAFNEAPKERRRHFRHWSEAFLEDARQLLRNHFDDIDLGLMMDAVAMPDRG